ncbi:MAG: hypothetical protein IKL22_08955 [Lachnospiraceae bacterium]|nr:hypothetical protein [Lachnospiraceae bacterium]
MHVAVCDDNIADRKQMERLLGRESDRRAKLTEGLYIDSYGNENALLRSPMQYDIFYIDMCKSEGITGTQVAKKLCDIGVQVPIFMCCSDLDYRAESFPKNVFFLDKPIKVDHLTASLDQAYEWKLSAVPRIELRDDTDTYYITAEDILYSIGAGKHSKVHLQDGRIIQVTSGIENLYSQWMHHKVFLLLSGNIIINQAHVARTGFLSVTMKDGKRFVTTPAVTKSIQP